MSVERLEHDVRLALPSEKPSDAAQSVGIDVAQGPDETFLVAYGKHTVGDGARVVVFVTRADETQMLEAQRRVQEWLAARSEDERERIERECAQARRVAELVNEVASRSALDTDSLRHSIRVVAQEVNRLAQSEGRVVEETLSKLKPIQVRAVADFDAEAQRVAEREARRRCPSCSNTKSVFLPACRTCLRSMTKGRKRGRR